MSIDRNSMKKFIEDRHLNIKVLMFGTGFDVRGGVTSVQQLIIDAHYERLHHKKLPNIKIQHVPTIVRGSAWRNILVFVRAIGILCWSALWQEVDVIHIHFSERGSTLRKSILISIGLLLRQSIILHAHGATYQEFYAGLPTSIQKILAFLFSKCSKIIVLSKSWQDYYVTKFRLDRDRVVVLYNPVQMPASIPYRQGRKQLKFVFLGRIGKRGGPLDLAKSLISFPKQDKGAFDLIEAFAALPPADRDRTELVLAGNGDLDTANQLIAKLELADKITILTWLNPEQRDKLLATADAFILPSYNEGLPMSMLEAMAWGLPVIVTPVGGIPEAVRNRQNGLLVQPGNQVQLSQAMQQLIEDENLRISLGNAARQSIEHLDIQHYSNALAHLYTSVAKKNATVDCTMQSRQIP
jgi:glycosyltransferase involved in cell wall biosynthesis